MADVCDSNGLKFVHGLNIMKQLKKLIAILAFFLTRIFLNTTNNRKSSNVLDHNGLLVQSMRGQEYDANNTRGAWGGLPALFFKNVYMHIMCISLLIDYNLH